MTNYYVKVTKSLITDVGSFSTGEYVEFTYKDRKVVGKITDFDEVNGRLFVDLLGSKITKSVFELKDVENLTFVIYD